MACSSGTEGSVRLRVGDWGWPLLLVCRDRGTLVVPLAMASPPLCSETTDSSTAATSDPGSTLPNVGLKLPFAA